MVVLTDVELGGYTIRALAKGLECPPQEVELALPDEVDVVVVLRLHAPGFLTGRVVDTATHPIEGIRVTIENVATAERRALVTDGRGTYVASQLPDGDYRVFVGEALAPLAAVDDVSFAAPSLHMPDLVTPVLGELVVLVVDTRGTPVQGASVEATGLRSGPLELVTEADGRARARFCCAGRVSLLARHTRVGQGDTSASFEPGVEDEITVRIGE